MIQRHGLVGALLLAVLAVPLTPRAAPGADADVLHQLDGALQRVVAKVSPAVVQILVTGYGPIDSQASGDPPVLARQHAIASGVIIDPDGWVVTNHHVVRGAQRIRVVLPAPLRGSIPDGQGPGRQRSYDARVVGSHPETDLALLKIEAHGLPALPLGADRQVHEGQLVLAVGSPQGLASTVTMGVISSAARQAELSAPMLVIQTDAPINPGNSGGPLVDTDGYVVGVNAFIYTESGGSQGLGFAIPASVVKFVSDSLRRRGRVHRVELGLAVQAVNPVLAAGLGLERDWGVIVADVQPGGPAERAGVRSDDLIESIDGRPVDTLAAMATALYLHPPKRAVKLAVRRGTRRTVLEIEGAEPTDPTEEVLASASPDKNFLPKLGIVGVEIDGRLVAFARTLRRGSGVVVAARMSDPSAVESGIEPGDVIHAINRAPVTSIETLRRAVQALRDGDAVVLQIERQGKLQYLAFEME